MGSLKQRLYRILLAFASFASVQKAQAQDPNLPRDIFANDPISSYWVWWRPQKVIFDPMKVREIQTQIAAIRSEDANSVNIERAFGEHGSAFLFPVLATHGDKGMTLLKRFLEPYTKSRMLDDTWLLIIASLGRTATPKAQNILERELRRVLSEWTPSETITVRGRQIHAPRPDVRRPVLDALLACIAGQKALTARKIEDLSTRGHDPTLAWFSWIAGLEWTRQLMREAALLTVISDALELCEETEILTAMELQASSERLDAIWAFLHDNTDTWPNIEELLLRHSFSKPVISDYLLIQYMYVLSYKAQIGHGTYPLNDQVVSLISRREIGSHGKLSYISRVLSGCKTLQDHPQWDQFLAKHAAMLAPSHEDVAASHVQRILESKDDDTKRLFDRHARTKALENIKTPGVHIVGLTGARQEPSVK